MLAEIGVPFTVARSRAQELLEGGTVRQLAERNALAKLHAALLPQDVVPGSFVLGTDTLVSVDDRVLGKPASAPEALQMLELMAGRTHEVVSGVALARTVRHGDAVTVGACRVASAVTRVTFLPLERTAMEAYVSSGEWRGKAGGYAIQGLAGLFVSEVHGEYSNVVGLPLCLLGRMFRELGFDLLGRAWL